MVICEMLSACRCVCLTDNGTRQKHGEMKLQLCIYANLCFYVSKSSEVKQLCTYANLYFYVSKKQ